MKDIKTIRELHFPITYYTSMFSEKYDIPIQKALNMSITFVFGCIDRNINIDPFEEDFEQNENDDVLHKPIVSFE